MSLEKTFKALADKNRREILNLLKKGSLSAGDIAKNFNMTNATISYHLSILRDANLIVEEKHKNYIYYQLNSSVFEDIMAFALSFKEDDNDE